MISYENFERDILNCFDEVMKKYSLKLIADRRQKGWFILKGRKLEINFSFDRGSIYCQIKVSKKEYLDIVEFINQKEIKFPKEWDPWNSKQLLSFYAQQFIDHDMISELVRQNINQSKMKVY